jgi:hypothetical protein
MDDSDDAEESVRVFVRVRPLNSRESGTEKVSLLRGATW